MPFTQRLAKGAPLSLRHLHVGLQGYRGERGSLIILSDEFKRAASSNQPLRMSDLRPAGGQRRLTCYSGGPFLPLPGPSSTREGATGQAQRATAHARALPGS